MSWLRIFVLVILSCVFMLQLKDLRVFPLLGLGVLIWYAFGSHLGGLFALFPAIRLPGASKRKQARPRFVYVEGPPAAGKTWLIKNKDFEQAFGHPVNWIPEDIDQLALTDFEDPQKKAIVAYTFDVYMIASRLVHDAQARAYRERIHVFDRSNIGGTTFHGTCTTLGFHTAEQAESLKNRQLINEACMPIERDNEYSEVPEIVIIYCGAHFEVCHDRLVKRDGVDSDMTPEYHKLNVFIHAYTILHIAERFPNVGFLVDSNFPSSPPGAREYAAGKRAAIKAAYENLDIVLSADEHKRFCSLVEQWHKPEDFTWTKNKQGQYVGQSKSKIAAQNIARVTRSSTKAAAESE